MYSDEREPSRPARRRRVLAWIVGVALFVAASTYAIGGRGFVRELLRIRFRARQALQPPSDAEMQRATERAAEDSANRAAAMEDMPQPVSLGVMAISTGTILVIAVAAFYITGRKPRRRA